jgi:hypothetical protein
MSIRHAVAAFILLLSHTLCAAAPKTVSPITRPASSRAALAPGSGPVAPLSATECGKLGGTIDVETSCRSQFKCITTDQNHNSHAVCITSVK